MHVAERWVCLATLIVLIGCGRGADEAGTAAQIAPADASGDRTGTLSNDRPPASGARINVESGEPEREANNFDFAPLTLNSLPTVGEPGESSAAPSADPEQQIQLVMEQLHPLQILLGQWRGTTRRDYDGFKAVDAHEWIWDLQTNPRQPALVLKSDKSPYLRSARLTWDIGQGKFTMTATDADSITRTYHGEFTEPVHEIVGSDDKLHRVYRLEFTEDPANSSGSTDTTDGAPAVGRELWRVAFAQQENNRYLTEIDQRRGNADFRRFDTVSTQREGTSFALSDSGYAEKTCVISQGLGTIELTYKGRTYWVCCTGCKAAFEEDPETWIARDAKRTTVK